MRADGAGAGFQTELCPRSHLVVANRCSASTSPISRVELERRSYWRSASASASASAAVSFARRRRRRRRRRDDRSRHVRTRLSSAVGSSRHWLPVRVEFSAKACRPAIDTWGLAQARSGTKCNSDCKQMSGSDADLLAANSSSSCRTRLDSTRLTRICGSDRLAGAIGGGAAARFAASQRTVYSADVWRLALD